MILWQIFMVGTVWCWCQQISQDIAIIVITKVVEMLLDRGANPDSRDHDGESAVHAAVREESAQMLQILLKVPNTRIQNPHLILILLEGWCQPKPSLTPRKVPPAPGSRAKPAAPSPPYG